MDRSGLVWLSGEHGWQTIATNGKIVARFPSTVDRFGGWWRALAFGRGYAWVESLDRGYKIHRFDLHTHGVVGPAIRTPADTLGLGYASTGTLWALTGGGVTAIDGPHAGFSQPVRIRAPGSNTIEAPTSLAIDTSGGLWVGTARGVVVRLDASGRVAGPPIDVGRGNTLVAAAGNAIWALNPANDTLTSIRTVGPGKGAIQARVTIPGARLPSTISCIPHKCVITHQFGGADHHTSEVIEASF